MIAVIRDSAGNIKTFSDSPLDDYNLVMGETREIVDSTFADYSRRFMLQVGDTLGQTVYAKQGGEDVIVTVSTSLKIKSVDLDINGMVERVPLTDGQGHIVLDVACIGTFIITPADRKLFSAAGNGSIAVEVIP